jgi:hypothetical protein
MPPKQKEPPDRRPEMLGRVIARELGFDRDESIRTAIQRAVKDELDNGQTEVQAHATITSQWKRWEPIAGLFPGIGTDQFFLTRRKFLSNLEESARHKRTVAAVLPPPRTRTEDKPRRTQTEQKPTRTFATRRQKQRLTVPASFGIYDPSKAPIYSAEDQAFIDAFTAKPTQEITSEELAKFHSITKRGQTA